MDRNGTPHAKPRLSYLNCVLTVIAALLTVVAAQGTIWLPGLSEAEAQPARRVGEGASGGIINPADQRQAMIAELRRVNERLDRIAEHVNRQPFDVAVVRMPNDSGKQGD